MKRIQVFELAKKKNISSREVIEILGRKGFKKVSAITYVNPDVMDSAPERNEKKRMEPVSHLFGVPGRGGSVATAQKKLAPIKKAAPSVKTEPGKKEKKVAAVKAKSAARPASLRQTPQDGSQKSAASSGKKGKNKAALTAMALGLALLVAAVGFLYTELRSQKAMFASMGAELKADAGRIDSAVTANSKRIAQVEEHLKRVNGDMKHIKRAGLISNLKSQSAVMGALSKNLDEPLKSKTRALANRLAKF